MTALDVAPAVAAALAEHGAVVALESSLIAQGLPAPHNLETALRAEEAVRAERAVPATIALDDGRIIVGAGQRLLERLAAPGSGAAKAASRDLGPLLAARRLAATTVSATIRAARMAGISVFATGGIGGVHPGASASFDVSSDVDELASTPAAVVSSGAKSLLDLPATLELLETRRVPVVGLATRELPAFYSVTSGLPVPHTVEGVREAATVAAAHLALPGAGAILFVQPPPSELAIDAAELESVLARAVSETEGRVRGGDVTPAVLSRLAELTGGRTVLTNIGLVINNARTAARLARALVEVRQDGS